MSVFTPHKKNTSGSRKLSSTLRIRFVEKRALKLLGYQAKAKRNENLDNLFGCFRIEKQPVTDPALSTPYCLQTLSLNTYLELVQRVQGIDAGHAAILQAQ